MLKKLLLSLFFIPATLSFAFADVSVDLDGYYNLNTGATDSLGATNGTGSGGIIYNSLYGKISGGAYFPSATDYIDLGSTQFNYSANDISICAWVNPSLANNTEGVIVSNYNSGGSYAQYQLKLYKAGSADPKLVYNIAQGSQQTHTSTTGIPNGTWAHVCSVYVRSSGQVSFYINNVFDSSYTFSVVPTGTFGNTSIGRGGSYNGIYYKGYMDEVGIWSKALSGGEIDTLYNGGTGLTYPFTTGGGTPTATSSIYATSTIISPATIYSSQFIKDPVSTSTYSFTSTVASSTGKQSGVIFIVHSTSTTPTISWGGTAMTLLDTTATLSGGYRTSMFVLRNPTATSSIVISGLSASSTKYISQSVWNNAVAYAAFDTYSVTTASNVASIALPTPSAPTGLVASMYTESGLSGFSVLSGSTVIQSATSSTGDFSVLRSQCASALNDCLVGYTKPFALFDTRNGAIIGVSMYATSSVISSSIPDIGVFTGGLGTPEGFADCLDDGLTGSIMCLGKNMVFWTFGLFVPNNEDLVDIKNTVYSTITASSSLTSSIFLLPLQMSLWTASSSVPAYDNLTLSLPRVTGGYYTAELSGVNTTNAQKRIDASLYSIFIWILGVFTVFFISKQFIKFIH